MSPLLLLCPLVLVGLLLAAAGMPSRWANRHPRQLRTTITVLIGLQAGWALLACVGSLPALISAGAPLYWRWPAESLCSFSLYYDGVSSLMLLLVSCVGFVVAQYSIRYVDGEAHQGRYFCWVGMTVGAVSLLVISGNLLLLFAAWLLASLGLHQLLLFYPARPAAQRAAWTKFAISRIGDVFLAGAVVLIWQQFGTFEFPEIFAALQAAAADPSSGQSAIAWLLVLAAVTKSAQFPFHTWLPETLETPTPVSALMHAGIVNAGGYLVIRTSPLVVSAPLALVALAGIGTLTVCFAGIVMLTQTSIKRSLAYSTIAQMGFMMLQCGLGAFSAATLHILAHSLYKAYAFLNSGSVLAVATNSGATNSSGGVLPPKRVAAPDGWETRQQATETSRGQRVVFGQVLAGGLLAATILAGVAWLCGMALTEKPGGAALGLIVVLAMATWLWDVFRLQLPITAGAAVAALLALLYLAAFASVEAIVGSQLPTVPSTLALWIVGSWIALAFAGLAALQLLLTREAGRSWLGPLQVHASNGFYVAAWFRRLCRRAGPSNRTAAVLRK